MIKYFLSGWRLPLVVAVTALLVFTAVIDIYITASASSRVYRNVSEIPWNKCGLLLGTSKYRVEGGLNPYFLSRINAAVELYRSGKINFIIASGDNSEKYYNEPQQMKKYLVMMGVPKEKVFMDFAGFRTLDSVIRAKYIFGQDSITVISQKFHVDRAIYIARENGIEAAGFAAGDVKESGYIRLRFREFLARLKAFVDIHILEKKPKFLGNRIQVD